MYRFFSMAKNKALPAVVAAVFIVSTAFLSSAAAQKMIQVAASSQNTKTEKKNSVKSPQASIVSSKPEDANGAGTEPVRAIQTTSSGTALAALTATGSEDENVTANSTVASTTIQTANSGNTQNSRSSASINNSASTSNISASSAVSLDSTASGASSGNAFTLQTLALHNKAGDCYIAYKGTVYDLSGVAAWANCQHHGATGGIDVTALFPHPVSYFNSVPAIGMLVSAASQTTSSNTLQNNQGSSSANPTTSTSSSTGTQAAGSNGTEAGSGSVSTTEASRSRWAEEDEFVKSDGNISRQSQWEDDGEDDD
ncbi:MAG: hypothetical protein M1333_01610 [Patescibacteria group bacterium]|nr:hypothetical protein [Patescibacteria group bacterium]